MNNKVIKAAVIFTITTLAWNGLLYAVISFTIWETNPIYWSAELRAVFAWFGIIVGVMAGVLVASYSIKN